MLRKLAVLAILAVVLATAYGAAASLGVNGGAIQYGIDQDLRCDADGVKVAGWGLETNDNTVRSVRIGDISDKCFGNEMFIQVLDSGNGVLAKGTVKIGSAEEKFSFPSPYLKPESISQLKVWIEGEYGR